MNSDTDLAWLSPSLLNRTLRALITAVGPDVRALRYVLGCLLLSSALCRPHRLCYYLTLLSLIESVTASHPFPTLRLALWRLFRPAIVPSPKKGKRTPTVDFAKIGKEASPTLSANSALAQAVAGVALEAEKLSPSGNDPLKMLMLHTQAKELQRALMQQAAEETPKPKRKQKDSKHKYQKAIKAKANDLRKSPEWATKFAPFTEVMVPDKISGLLWPLSQSAFNDEQAKSGIFIQEHKHVKAILKAAAGYLPKANSKSRWRLGACVRV